MYEMRIAQSHDSLYIAALDFEKFQLLPDFVEFKNTVSVPFK